MNKATDILKKRAHVTAFSTALLAAGIAPDAVKKVTIKAAAAYDKREEQRQQVRGIVLDCVAAKKAV